MKKSYKTRDACFFCSSLYQIIGAIGIVKSKNIDADLYITPNEFKDCEALVKKIRTCNVFTEIYIATIKGLEKRDIISRKIRSLKMTFFPEIALSSYLPTNISYNEYYISSRSTLKAAQLAVLRKRNSNVKRVIFEDGLGTYSNDWRLLKVSCLRRIFESILGWKLDDPRKMRVMVYLPELLTMPEQLKDVPVEQMPRLEINDETRALMSDIFSLNENNNIKERYIIFDTKRSAGVFDHLTEEEKIRLDNCFESISQIVGDDVILKPHPRSKEKPTCMIKTYQYQDIPMEALYFNMNDLGNRVLVSQASTAVFTPKIFLDCEPIIISLHNILRDNQLSKEFERTFNKFRSTYRNQNRTIAPRSIDELIEIVKAIG